jgi:hypothetical protein
MQTSELYNSGEDALLTVALPCFNAKQIGWLCMESLCKQEDAPAWELIICEEKQKNKLGKTFFKQYIDRLKEANCVRIVYLEPSEWIPLIDKWILIGLHKSPSSRVYTLQAIDCYTPSKRLALSYHYIYQQGYDWIDFSKGYFYSFTHNKVVLYDAKAKTNLHMSFAAKYCRKIQPTNLQRGIDGYLHNQVKGHAKRRIYHKVINTLLEDGIDTDGFNNISLKRNDKYLTPKFPFVEANKTIEELPLPAEVIERIKSML